MDVDAFEQVRLVTRTVETVDRDGKKGHAVTMTRTYATSVEDLWEAVTDPERIPRWFLPVSGDLRLGGRYRLEGNAEGEILACEPPRSFEITWEYGSETSWVAVELTGAPGGDEAELRLRHVAHPPEDFWNQYGPGAVGVGWDLGLLGLGWHLAGRPPVDPAEFEASPEARAFVAGSSEAWGAASIADGVDPAEARGQVERVTAFYTATGE